MNERVNISQVEDWLYGKLKGVVSDNVFAGSLPSVLEKSWDDMCYIDVTSLSDKSEYNRGFGQAMANVFVFVRPNSSGKKNVAKFNKIENDLYSFAENCRGEYFSPSLLYTSQDYNSAIGYHYLVFAFKILIH